MKKYLTKLEAAREKVKYIERVYEERKKQFNEIPCQETKEKLIFYMGLLQRADQDVLDQKYHERNAEIQYSARWPEYDLYEKRKAEIPINLSSEDYFDEIRKLINEMLI